MNRALNQALNLEAWGAEAPLPPPVHTLLVQCENAAVTRISIGGFPFVIGRGRLADLVLHDRAISRRHCRLDCEGDNATIQDSGSKTGTWLNGVRVSGAVPLTDGSLIRIGRHTLRYIRRDHTEEGVAALERERQEASAYVAAILPAPLTNGPVRAEWLFQPSAQLSGDAFGYEWLDNRWFTVFMLDVAGNGTAAALHAVSAANAIRQRMLPDVDFRDPGSVLSSLNRVFPMDRHDERFFTIWYGAYDAASRVLHFATGGHHPGFLVHPDDNEPEIVWHDHDREDTALRAPASTLAATAAAGRTERHCSTKTLTTGLGTRNPAVGILPDRVVQSGSVRVPVGSALHLFSDGAFEVIDRTGQPLGLQDFVALLPDASAPHGPKRLYDMVRARSGQLEDDFSALLLRFV